MHATEIAQTAATRARRSQLVKEFALLLDMRWASPDFTLDEAAAALHVSRRQLQRALRPVGSFRTILMLRRMNYAATLLETTTLPLSDVCRRVAYRQASQFSKAFKLCFGMSPSQYRGGRYGKAA